MARSRVTSVGLIVLPDPAEGFTYPAHIDRESLDALPRKPGVYLFRDASGMPLYIGKSVDIRSRVMSHLRTPQEATLLEQTHRIDFQRTAGEIGALLLESHLIKAWQPPYNAQLKAVRETFSLTLTGVGTALAIGDCETVEVGQRRFGLYTSRNNAMTALTALTREHQLCPALLGLDNTVLGRACFAHQIGRCNGACVGRESRDAHAVRLLAMLERLEDAVWSHAGPVGIVEQSDELRQVHIVERWSYLGTLEGRRRTLRRPARLRADADTFQILARPLREGRLTLSACQVTRDRVTVMPCAPAAGRDQLTR